MSSLKNIIYLFPKDLYTCILDQLDLLVPESISCPQPLLEEVFVPAV